MNCMRRLWVLNQTLVWKHNLSGCKRQLYSPSFLGLDSFIRIRKRNQENIRDLNTELERLQQIFRSDGLVFVDDIKRFLTVAETDEDIKLLPEILKKYNSQNKNVMINSYNFGAEVMRLLHVKNKPEEALKLFTDDDLTHYFQYFTSALLLFDLLFESGKYDEVISCYKYCYDNDATFIKSKQIILVLLAASYKSAPLNDSNFELVHNAHLNSFREPGRNSLKNAIIFAALAIKQNKPFLAIETFIGSGFNSLVENYRFMAFAQAKRFDNALKIMHNVQSDPSKSLFITSEALSFVLNEIQNSDEKNIVQFQKLKEKLGEQGLISNESLEKLLLQEIDLPRSQKSLNTRIKIPRQRAGGFAGVMY